MVATNTRVIKISTSSVTGFISQFNTNVVDAAYGYVNYTNSNYPYFSYTQSGLTNPIAIPSGHLADISKTYLSNSDTVITASSLWNAMVTVTRDLAKIRLFQSLWYYNDNDNQVLQTSLSGRAVFNTSYPAVPSGWTRSGATSVTISPTQTITAGTRATAANANSAITNCFNAWVSQCRDGNTLTYAFYTCHSQCHNSCHSSCHDSRGRR